MRSYAVSAVHHHHREARAGAGDPGYPRQMRTRIAFVAIISMLSACGGTTSGPGGSGGGPSTGGQGGAGGAATGGAGTGGSGTCNPACGTSRDCCVDHCVNLQNDPLNCGTCGHQCTAGTYCTGGACTPPPCQAACGGGTTCCGASCCAAGELCCDPQGPLDMGPVCTTPVNGTCPMGCAPLCICASPDTPIATPDGERAISALKVGDLVYSVDHGAMAAVPIVRVNRTPVSHHSVVRVALRTGEVLEISPGHPTADGRTFGGLHSGESMDGVAIDSATVVPYTHDATYDILPGSDTGTYFAGGVLIGSTLFQGAALVTSPTSPMSSP